MTLFPQWDPFICFSNKKAYVGKCLCTSQPGLQVHFQGQLQIRADMLYLNYCYFLKVSFSWAFVQHWCVKLAHKGGDVPDPSPWGLRSIPCVIPRTSLEATRLTYRFWTFIYSFIPRTKVSAHSWQPYWGGQLRVGERNSVFHRFGTVVSIDSCPRLHTSFSCWMCTMDMSFRLNWRDYSVRGQFWHLLIQSSFFYEVPVLGNIFSTVFWDTLHNVMLPSLSFWDVKHKNLAL